MRIPRLPPDRNAVFDQLLSKGPKRFRELIQMSQPVDERGRYLHWDEFRFKRIPDGFTAEEWWTATKAARDLIDQKLPLEDKQGGRFWFCEPTPLKVALRFVDMNAGGSLGADSYGISMKEGRTNLTRSLAEEPFASSFIEGAATTRQVAKQLIFEGRKPITRDERMVLNNYMAMEFVKEHRNDPLGLDLLLELHRIVTEETLDDPKDAGRIRTSDDVQVVDDSTGEVLHQPPPAACPKSWTV